jgi:chemotaxis protein methyltransferase CheR
MSKIENEKIEIQLLLETIYLKYGYDFRNYSKAHIKRRIMRRLSLSGFINISEMLQKILYDEQFFHTLLLDLSINVTEMFRDPSFYLALSKKVIPLLKIYPFIRIWNAGCATGEEVYSLAILLKEEGLYKRCRIYATDFNEKVIKKARNGIFPIGNMKEYTKNHKKAGGHVPFVDYYTARYNNAIMDSSLKENIVFTDHNLVTDGVFNEMELILCRNVLIYFNRNLQNSVLKLMKDSLRGGGFLCLGSKESVRFSECSDYFKDMVGKEKIYRKKLTR